MNKLKISLLAFLFLGAIASCTNDDDNNQEPDNEEEEITRVVVKATASGTTQSFSWDSQSGNDPERITLSPGVTYTVNVEFWNDEESPAENVTEEVEEEGTEHLLCFEVTDALMNISRTDTDSNGWELGLESSWQTITSSTGGVTLKLKHQPDLKTASVDCSVGETDVEVTFPVLIQ